MSDHNDQTTLTSCEIAAEDRLAAAAVEKSDDPFLEPGDDPDPAPINEPEPPTAPTAFMLLVARPRGRDPAVELIWTAGGGMIDPDSLRVPPAVRSGYAVCESAEMAVVWEDRDEDRGVVRRGYDVVGDWRAARPEDFESRPGRQFVSSKPEIPETLRLVYAKGRDDGGWRIDEDANRVIGIDGSEG